MGNENIFVSDAHFIDDVKEMILQLILVLNQKHPSIGLTAITSLLCDSFINEGIKKEEFLSKMNGAFDHYKNEYDAGNFYKN